MTANPVPTRSKKRSPRRRCHPLAPSFRFVVLPGDFIPGMGIQSRIIYAFNLLILGEKFRDLHRVFGMCPDRHRNVRIPRRTSQQSKGEGTAPPEILDGSHALEKLRSSSFATTIPPRHIAMTAEIFRGRMQDQIGAEIEGPLDDWRPGVVANAERAAVVHDFGDGGEIDHLQERIRGRLQPRPVLFSAAALFSLRRDCSCRRSRLPIPSAKTFHAATAMFRNTHRCGPGRDRPARAPETSPSLRPFHWRKPLRFRRLRAC